MGEHGGKFFGAFGRVNQAAKEHHITAYPPSSAKALTGLDPAHKPSTALKGPVLRLGGLRFFLQNSHSISWRVMGSTGDQQQCNKTRHNVAKPIN
jgi:hypothetical protein